jgi:hypothetical protein
MSAFLAGVAVAGVFGVYQLRGDVAEGQQRLLEQASRIPLPPHSFCLPGATRRPRAPPSPAQC